VIKQNREGVPETKAIGGVKPKGTAWQIVWSGDGVEKRDVGHGPTAFAACAGLGIAMGAVRSIAPETPEETAVRELREQREAQARRTLATKLPGVRVVRSKRKVTKKRATKKASRRG
jgi:hypothetical protein